MQIPIEMLRSKSYHNQYKVTFITNFLLWIKLIYIQLLFELNHDSILSVGLRVSVYYAHANTPTIHNDVNGSCCDIIDFSCVKTWNRNILFIDLWNS